MPEELQTSKETEEVKPETETKPVEEKPATPSVDYEKKFSESARENQILREKLKAQEDAAKELTKEPTDSEYRAAFPDWDVLDESQKADKRMIYDARQTSRKAAQEVQDLKAERSWNTSIELVLSSNPALQGKEQAFRDYVSKPQYRGTPMEILVDAFIGKHATAEPSKPTPRPGLETGSGGPRETPKPKTLTGEQLEALRKSDYRAYEQYIKTHDITVEE